MKQTILALTILLASCSSGGGSHHPAPIPQPTTSGWYIGPIVDGKNYSEGMPSKPTLQGQGWVISFPRTGGVDAVIKDSPPSLVGAKALVMKYTVTGGGFLATDESNVAGRVGICLQRKGDNWSGAGAYQQYRLYSTARPLLTSGAFTLTVPLVAGKLTDVAGKPASQAAIDSVVANLDNYSVVFGGSFASHGVYATQPSAFTMLSLTRQ